MGSNDSWKTPEDVLEYLKQEQRQILRQLSDNTTSRVDNDHPDLHILDKLHEQYDAFDTAISDVNNIIGQTDHDDAKKDMEKLEHILYERIEIARRDLGSPFIDNANDDIVGQAQVDAFQDLYDVFMKRQNHHQEKHQNKK